MSEHRERLDPQTAGEVVELEGIPHEPDLNVRAIVWSAVVLAATTAACCLLVWWLFLGLRSHIAADDRPLSPLREAQERVLPPAPRLQGDPAADMDALRASEKQALERPQWIDRGQGTLRIPIDLAMEVIAREGLRASAPSAATAPSPTTPVPQAPGATPPAAAGSTP